MTISTTCTVVYAAGTITDTSQFPDNTVFISHDQCDAVLFEEIRTHVDSDTGVFVVHADTVLPSYWQQRLLAAFKIDETVTLCSALSTQRYALSPIAASDCFTGSQLVLDQAIYLLAKPACFYTDCYNPDCFFVTSTDQLPDRHAGTFVAINNLLAQRQLTGREIATQNVPDIGDQRPLPAHQLAPLQLALKNHQSHKIVTEQWPYLDGKPILLHIAMDWGGGVHKWIDECAENHNDYHHLILLSHGELYRHRHGERLHLKWHSTSHQAFDEYHLQAPIHATAIEHAEYHQLIHQLIKDYQIAAIMVSSLIGHSMEVLTTGLPSIRILHDYFPDWPLLDARLEKNKITNNDYTAAYKQSCHEPFGCIDPNLHQQWVQQLHSIYRKYGTRLIAPSISVSNNLQKLQDGSAYADVTIIPHQTRILQPIQYQAVGDNRFTILVAGRISPPKGQLLLEECMQILHSEKDIHYVFLGAGNEGKKYLDDDNITVIMDYEADQLDSLLQEISPQLALMTSTASETFSYVLAELQSAGIPVLATTVGALQERIEQGVSGFLTSTDAKAMAAQILQLKKQPELREQVHTELLNMRKEQPQSAVSLGSLLKQQTLPSPQQRMPVMTFDQTHIYAERWQSSEHHKKQIADQLDKEQQEHQKKTEWAESLSEHNHELGEHLNTAQTESQQLKKTITDQQTRFQKEATELKSTIDEINTLRLQQEEEHQQLKHDATVKQQQLAEELNQRQQHIESLDAQIKAIRSSRSWRITKPIRVLSRASRNIKNSVKFRFIQMKSIPRRLFNSLRSRGLGGTIGVIRNKLRRQKPVVTPTQENVTSVDYQPIHVHSSDKPLVRIIIPVYNHFEHTYHCLQSIAALKDHTTFEVIVVDDCSTDETPEHIQLISGITPIRQKQNGGFISSCNLGAKNAQTEYLLFLNNDTHVHANWLDSLVKTFEDNDDVGLVGSKLIYPDGRLQEAGGIVFSDGSGWNYGRLDAADKAEYNHLREVTYCSGASILVRTEVFNKLGGFDSRYKPAYYEDTDMAFAMRDMGLKVYYQPASIVTHFEGISSGTDISSGTKKYQQINQHKFVAKWQQALAQQQQSGTDIELCRFQNQPQRLLILDACTPTPDQDSGSLRMLNLMQICKQLNYQITFIPENLSHFGDYTTDLQALGVECLYAPQYKNPVDYLKKYGQYFDVVILSRYYVAEPVMPFIRDYAPQAQVIFDTVDLHYLREQRMAEIEENHNLQKNADATKTKELGIAKQCDITLVVSPYEKEVLAQEIPDHRVEILSNIHEIYGSKKSYSERRDILFIGGYQHTPNVDAVCWFCEKIFPQIHQAIPDIQFHIIGSKAPAEVEKLGDIDGVVYHGFVEDIEPFMQDIRLAVAPLRYGAGVKGKVNMSMSYGQPVVGTKVAVEGMYTTHAEDVMMANNEDEFVAQVIQIYQNEALWSRVSQGGLENVQRWFSFEAAKTQLQNLLNSP
ncbi:glycosyltransferase [Marinicella sp. W31]|uniref:glycosyltransferase n=1 Tax=Marinicella sp. W31 TaxID=3023713 RepID=UPI0037573F7D